MGLLPLLPVLIVFFGLFGKGVMRLHQLVKAFFQHMSVDLCCRNVRMAKQFLHDAQIGAILKEMAGKRMPHNMRRNQRRCRAITPTAGRAWKSASIRPNLEH